MTATRMAITRRVSRSIPDCQLTHLDRSPIDYATAVRQHEAYEHALAELGYRVLSLPAIDALPDAVFVEDTAIVLDEIAVICRPGAPARQPETPSIVEVLLPWRELAAIEAPGTVDGGDLLRIGRTIWAGRSTRTNAEGVAQLRAILAPRGYAVHEVAIARALHLKSAITLIRDGDEPAVLFNPAWIDPSFAGPVERFEVDPTEPAAGNALLLGDALIYPESFVRTRERLEARGFTIHPVPASELAKAEGGVTCCSLVFGIGV
ncbi:MAG: dimethylarginine dimethylaminohydrolase family protein [Thermoanaerobaculia bacterium]